MDERPLKIRSILEESIKVKGSDVFIVPGAKCSIKINGIITPYSDEVIKRDLSSLLIGEVYTLSGRSMDILETEGDDDFSFSIPEVGRFRCNAFRQRNSLAMVLRVVDFNLPNPKLIGIPDTIIDFYQEKNGLILVTGPAGSGKSTTLACIIDRINHEKIDHIITIEDPIEFIHRHDKSIVSQREITHDTKNYETALRAALREAPDVILLGEMRDHETIATALTATETGHLVFSSLHTIGAAKTIDRIIDVFSPNQQQQVRVQLSMVLKAVVSQQLLPDKNGKLIPAFEIMKITPAISNLIREGKTYQIDNVIYSSKELGMNTMDSDILRLYKEGKITKETAMMYAVNPSNIQEKLK